MKDAFSLLLRDPAATAARCREGRQLSQLAVFSIVALLLGGGIFGAILGAERSSLQALYSALKLSAAWFLSLVLCVPSYYALVGLLGQNARFRELTALVLLATGRAALVLLALAPVVWLVADVYDDYHKVVLAAALAYGGAGLAAVGVLARRAPRHSRRGLEALLMVGCFFLIGGQVAWALRPYVGRPADDSVPFVRKPEGAFFATAFRTTASALGYYRRTAPHWSRSSETAQGSE